MLTCASATCARLQESTAAAGGGSGLASYGSTGAAAAAASAAHLRDSSVLYSWVQHRVGHYLQQLAAHLPSITEGGNLASVLEHCMVRRRHPGWRVHCLCLQVCTAHVLLVLRHGVYVERCMGGAACLWCCSSAPRHVSPPRCSSRTCQSSTACAVPSPGITPALLHMPPPPPPHTHTHSISL